MNAAITDYDGQGLDFKVEFRRRDAGSGRSSEKSRGPSYRRASAKGPVQHNGIHRRRRSRMKW